MKIEKGYSNITPADQKRQKAVFAKEKRGLTPSLINVGVNVDIKGKDCREFSKFWKL